MATTMEQRKRKTIEEVILCEILCENEIMWENSKSNQLLAQRMVGLATHKSSMHEMGRDEKESATVFSSSAPEKLIYLFTCEG